MGKAALKLNVPRIKLKYRGVVVLKYIYIYNIYIYIRKGHVNISFLSGGLSSNCELIL